jgi:hypothetical protein
LKQYIISYIEDNTLGVYEKEILVEEKSLWHCVDAFGEMYPTLTGVREVKHPLSQEWVFYYSHEAQDQLQRSKNNMLQCYRL